MARNGSVGYGSGRRGSLENSLLSTTAGVTSSSSSPANAAQLLSPNHLAPTASYASSHGQEYGSDAVRPSFDSGLSQSRDPFRDPSLMSRSSSRAVSSDHQHHAQALHGDKLETRVARLHLENSTGRGEEEERLERPSIDKRPSEIVDDLKDAMSDEDAITSASSRRRHIEPQAPESGPRRAHSRPSPSSSRSGSGSGFFAQFRSGTGWFSPVVPPEPKLSREEREKANAERIAKLKEGTKKPRPGLLKRASSGVEMVVSSISTSGRARSNSRPNRIAED